MPLDPLPLQTPKVEESSKEETQEPTVTVNADPATEEEQVVRYFWCSWPDFRIVKPGRPLVVFQGRLLETSDTAAAEWLSDLVGLSSLSCEIKELSKEEYLQAKFDEQEAGYQY